MTATTANEDDRDRNADAGNPGLVPEKAWNYSMEMEYRLPEDVGVFSTRVFYTDIEDYIGKINATVDPDKPLSAVGNIGPAERWGLSFNASTRLSYWNQPDAIASVDVELFDSSAVDPFLGVKQRIGDRGFSRFSFRHDITDLDLAYGVEYDYPFNGGDYEVDITTITRNDRDTSLDLFVSRCSSTASLSAWNPTTPWTTPAAANAAASTAPPSTAPWTSSRRPAGAAAAA